MASRLISDLHPDLQPLCKQFLADCAAESIKVGISCTYRSNEEQDADYAKGRDEPGKIITNAMAGESPHNTTLDGKPASLAFDFFIYAPNGSTLDWDAEDEQWRRVIEIGQDLGLISGSTFNIKDTDHMEMPFWKDKRNVPIN